MNKRTGFLLALIFSIQVLSAQITLAPSVVSSGGGYYEGGDMSISWTIGELAVTTLEGGDLILTQGFQQPNIAAVGISQVEDMNWGISVYPNPVANEVNVRFSIERSGEYLLEIQDVTGRLFMQQEHHINPGDELKLNMGAYISGIYFLKVSVPGQGQVQVSPLRKL